MSNTNIKGSFWGFEVRRRQLTGAWVTSAYVAAPPEVQFGWFSGGYATTQRVDYNNDTSTASTRGSLSSSRVWLAATGNTDYGWFGAILVLKDQQLIE